MQRASGAFRGIFEKASPDSPGRRRMSTQESFGLKDRASTLNKSQESPFMRNMRGHNQTATLSGQNDIRDSGSTTMGTVATPKHRMQSQAQKRTHCPVAPLNTDSLIGEMSIRENSEKSKMIDGYI